MYKIRNHAQYWDNGSLPSLADAVETCHLAFALLAEAVPIALQHIGSCESEKQLEFWRAFIDLDLEMDITMCAGMDGVGQSLDEIRSNCNEVLVRMNAAESGEGA